MKLLRLLLVCFLVLLLGSCKRSALAPYGPVFEAIFKTDTSLFRGTSLGTAKAVVKQLETVGLKEENQDDGVDYLFYELKTDSAVSYTVAYYFPDQHLNSIEADFYLENEPRGAALFSTFKAYFDSRFGPSTQEGDFFNWVTVIHGKKIEISLADESPTYRKGKLTLDIHAFEE